MWIGQLWPKWACKYLRWDEQVSQDSTPQLASPSLLSATDKTQKLGVYESCVLLCSHHNNGIFTLRLHLHIRLANKTVLWAATVTGSKSGSAFEKLRKQTLCHS